MPTRRRHFRHAGFSLLEVLIVVSIIAVLMSVLIGGAAAAYNMARQNRTKAVLASLDAVIAEYHQTTGDYPDETVTGLSMANFLTKTYGTDPDGKYSIGRCGEMIRGLDNRLVGSPPTDVKDAWDRSIQFYNPNKGAYNNGDTYYIGDVVSDSGKLYRRISNDGTSGVATTNTAVWTPATAWGRPWFWSWGSNGVNESGTNGHGNNGSTGGDDLGSDGSKQ